MEFMAIKPNIWEDFLFTFSKDPFFVDKGDETLLTLDIQTTGFLEVSGPKSYP